MAWTFSSFLGKRTVVGIDIGSSTVKAVEVEQRGADWHIVNAAVEPMPLGCCRDGVITNIEEVAKSIRSLLRSAGFRATEAITAISGSQVIVRQVQFPKMTEAALRRSVKYEASKFISAPIEESVVEFEIMGDSAEPSQMNVMLVAAPKDMVDSRVLVLEQAGIEPIAVDVEAFALLRSLVKLRPNATGNDKTIALADMGATHTDVNIVSCGEFALTRNIPIAGDSFTNSIRSVFNVNPEEAERMKQEMTVSDSNSAQGGEGENRTWRAVQPLMEELLREIRRSINFYQSQLPEGSENANIERILLCGGSALIPGIGEYFSSRLNIHTEVADLFNESLVKAENLSPEFKSRYGPMLAIVVGLSFKEQSAANLAKAA